MRWYLMALGKYAQFGGRSQRKEFWYFFLFYSLFSIPFGVVDMFLIGTSILGTIYFLVFLTPSLAVGVRRLHDMGRSGWWMLLYTGIVHSAACERRKGVGKGGERGGGGGNRLRRCRGVRCRADRLHGSEEPARAQPLRTRPDGRRYRGGVGGRQCPLGASTGRQPACRRGRARDAGLRFAVQPANAERSGAGGRAPFCSLAPGMDRRRAHDGRVAGGRPSAGNCVTRAVAVSAPPPPAACRLAGRAYGRRLAVTGASVR